jgi:hypothetical protein
MDEKASPTLKKYNSPGSDQIPAEPIQAGGETLWFEIHNLINSVFQLFPLFIPEMTCGFTSYIVHIIPI